MTKVITVNHMRAGSSHRDCATETLLYSGNEVALNSRVSDHVTHVLE